MSDRGGAGPTSRSLERNLSLIWIHAGVARALVYLPIFVLFTEQRFGVHGAVRLASLSYLFIVALEVPSGWMSDRFGRVPTLTVAAGFWIVAHTLFLVGDDRFVVIALGQFFVAAGFAFLSGTDVSFHYDTLEGLGRADEYQSRQARVAAVGYAVGATGAITGGLVGLIDLRIAFAVSLVLAVVQLGVVRLFVEPSAATRAEAFVGQIGSCLAYLSDRLLKWIFFYGIALVTLEHVAFTLLQPWLLRMLDKTTEDLGSAPLLSGVVLTSVAAVGAIAARGSAPLARRFGTVATLVGLAVVSAVVVTGMALSFSAFVLILVGFRSVQGAAAPVLISAAVAPRTEQHHRATLLSLNSLAGRLGYGLLLQFVALDAGDDVRPVLETLSVISWALVVLLVVSAVLLRRSPAGTAVQAGSRSH